MNKDNESRGFNPKQRIIGAVILVVLAIIIVPLVLNKRERPVDPDAPTAQTVVTDLPAGDTAPNASVNTPTEARVGTAPLPDIEPVNPNAPQASTAPAATGTIPSDPLRAQSPTAAAGDAAPATPAAVAPPSAASKSGSTRETHVSAAKGWYVQVGTFANPANAEQLAARLQKAGFKVVQERVRNERTSVVRVRVGPYGKEGQAKTGQARIQKAVGIKGMVRHY